MLFYQFLKELDLKKFVDTLIKWNVAMDIQDECVSFIERLLKETPIVTEGLLNVDFEDADEVSVGVLEPDGKTYALDFTPWEICLGYNVDEDVFQKISKEEFAFHVLYDMSFDGFYREDRDARLSTLVKRIETIENK